ncbi:hypothetical protein [Leifsonia xyli]|uniref:hypothetical protein n=1 Tax=Leifsonia xyli TaxID=1575 RepID=UPI0012FE66B1
MSIVAPNLDKISARTFDTDTLGGRRALRGLFVFLASIGGCLLILGGAVAIAWMVSLLGGV